MSALRAWFGPSREDMWRRLSAEIGASYVEGGFWKGDKVQASHGEWTLTLDTAYDPASKMTYTRLRAPYVNPDGFRFTIHRRGLFSDIAKRLGMQDVEIGHADFDRGFIVKGTDVAKLRALFHNPRIRDLVSAQPHIRLTVKSARGYKAKFPKGTDELCFSVAGIIKDVDRLKQLFDLFAETLDQLCRIGSAYERAPS